MDFETAQAIGTLRAGLNHLSGLLRHEMRDGVAQNQRHLDVAVETLRREIEHIVQELASLNAKMESLRSSNQGR
jgi:hypothetical protein